MTDPLNRRTVLRRTGAVATMGLLAGCGGDGEDGGEDGDGIGGGAENDSDGGIGENETEEMTEGGEISGNETDGNATGNDTDGNATGNETGADTGENDTDGNATGNDTAGNTTGNETAGNDTNETGGDGEAASAGASEEVSEYLSDTSNFDGEVTDNTGQDTVTVTVGAEGNDGNFAFEPAAVSVSQGTTVEWEWTGEGGAHNVVSEGDGPLDSGEPVEEEGVNYEYTFEETGTFLYNCVPHDSLGMRGAVVVE